MPLPDGRTFEYSVWRACERFGLHPPDVSTNWDDCHHWIQMMLISYDQVRRTEEFDIAALGLPRR